MKSIALLCLLLILFNCSQQKSPQLNDLSNALAPSQLLEQEIENINQELADKQQYTISQEDLALIKEEEILTDSELQELAKFAN